MTVFSHMHVRSLLHTCLEFTAENANHDIHQAAHAANYTQGCIMVICECHIMISYVTEMNFFVIDSFVRNL